MFKVTTSAGLAPDQEGIFFYREERLHIVPEDLEGHALRNQIIAQEDGEILVSTMGRLPRLFKTNIAASREEAYQIADRQWAETQTAHRGGLT